MMRSFLAAFGLILFISSTACAADAKPDPAKPDPALCRALTAYKPSADVEYKPGVDVRGNAVAPADLPDSVSPQMPSKITLPLTVSLAKILNLDTTKFPNSALGTGTETQIGMLEVEGNHVTFNGQPLSNEQQSNLAVLCEKSKTER